MKSRDSNFSGEGWGDGEGRGTGASEWCLPVWGGGDYAISSEQDRPELPDARRIVLGTSLVKFRDKQSKPGDVTVQRVVSFQCGVLKWPG